METTVEVTEGLERKVTFFIPAGEIKEQITERLQNLAKTTKMKGFRTGKVPLPMVEVKNDNENY